MKRKLYEGENEAAFTLCSQGASLPSDSFMRYAQMAKKLSLKTKDFSKVLLADYYIGKCYVYKGSADSGLIVSKNALKSIIDPKKYQEVYHELWGLKITCLTKLKKFDETFPECYQLLESGEKSNDLAAQIFASNSLGSAYFNFSSDFKNAKKWWLKAYHLMDGTNFFNEFPQVPVNLSYLYYGIDKNIDSAQFFLDKAFIIATQTQSLKAFADCYTTQADIDNMLGKTREAEKMLQKGVAMYRQIGNTESIMESLGTLADFYTDRKDYAKAIEYEKQTEAYLGKSHSGQLTEFYRSFAETYEKTGNYLMADSMLHKFIYIHDSLNAKSKIESLAELEAKYELSNREAAIAKQKLELLHKNILIAGAGLAIFLTAAIASFLTWQGRKKQIAALKDAEEKERKRIAADLHDNIGAYAAAISAAIDEIDDKNLIPDRGILSSLKNNVAEISAALRDTIWAFHKESISLTGLSDRVKNFVQKIGPAYPFIHIALEENIAEDKKLMPVRALHIFRIIQEAVNNSARHSNGSTILISIGTRNGRASISIEDNGTGFDPSAVIDAGNGLFNMKSRATESGFTIRFLKSLPKGFKVELEENNKI